MTDLADFLRARFAEDEAAARAVGDQGWLYHGVKTGGLANPEAKLQHSDRWMPSRVLAECEAKRRIVEGIRDATDGPVTEYYIGPMMTTDDVLRLLALPYADHPDWREEWRP